jgi:hypothetical protein
VRLSPKLQAFLTCEWGVEVEVEVVVAATLALVVAVGKPKKYTARFQA